MPVRLPRGAGRPRGLGPIVLALLGVSWGEGVAQTRVAPEAFAGAPAPGVTGPSRRPVDGPAPARVLLYSALVPGAGQYALGQRRWVLYLGAEALALGSFLNRRSAGRDGRRAYRDLAWETARASVAPRTDPGFEYYERLAHWTRSGGFDLDPSAPGIQPETDPTTFNGSVWARAERIFLPTSGPHDEGSMAYARAIAYYGERAYAEPLAWDWRGLEDAQGRFRGLIEDSDEAFRQATVAAALLLANHVLSGTDAFVAARLRALTGGRVEGALRLQPAPAESAWRLGIVLSH